MTTTVVQNLSKTANYFSEVLKTAPTDIDVVVRSKKYRILRSDLTDGLMNKAWGVRVVVSAIEVKELRHQIRNIINAANSWALAIELEKRHGLKISTQTKLDLDQAKAVVDLYFILIKTPE
jgi:hypothetical protein